MNRLGLGATAMVVALIVTGASAQPPHVLLIMVDDLGYGDLSSYGATDLKSPHVDKLIASGVRFTHFYANCCVCSPTRASAMTGRYPDMVGVPGVIRTHPEDSWGYFDPKAITLPDMMHRVGYHTAAIGKWHLGLEDENHPNARSFDLFHGFLGDMMDDYYTHLRHNINYMRLNRETVDPKGHATDVFTQWAIDYLTDRATNHKDQPWFLYLAYNAPHNPIQPPQEWLDRVKAREKDITDKRAKIVALIEHLDDGIGKVLATLDRLGATDHTLIVFTSDNGGLLSAGANNGPLREGKQHMYEGGIRVAASFVWPGHIKPGSTTDAIAITMDIYPTLCEVAGVKVDHTIDGTSILPTLMGEDQKLDRTLVWMRREGGNYQGQDYYAVRRGDWKLLHDSPFTPLELYDVVHDTREETDVSQKNRRQYSDLAAQLRLHLQDAGRVPWQRPE